MSKLTHYFELNVPKVEHHMVSESDALTITAQASAGEGETFLASKNGASNHVAGFKTGEDKILVPLELIQEFNPSTTITKGTLPAEKYGDSADQIEALGERFLYWVSGDEQHQMLTLDGNPSVVAADIEII